MIVPLNFSINYKLQPRKTLKIMKNLKILSKKKYGIGYPAT